MKITRSDLRQMILEMNPDGTISSDEDSREEALEEIAISQLEALLTYVNEEAFEIGIRSLHKATTISELPVNLRVV